MPIRAFPKKGETDQQALDRVKAEHPNEEVVLGTRAMPKGSKGGGNKGDPPSKGAYRTTPTSDKGMKRVQLLTPESLGGRAFRLPQPIIHTGPSGRGAATEIIRDPFLINRPAVYQFPNNNNFETTVVGGAAPSYFQFANATNQDTNVNNVIGPLMKSLFNSVVRQYMATVGRVFPNTLLNTGSNGQNDSLSFYMDIWLTTFMGLRALEGLLNAGDFNYASSLMAAAVNQNILRLQADLDKLNTYPMPQKIVDAADLFCGPKALDANSPLILASIDQFQTGGNDLTNQASIGVLLGILETEIGFLQSGPAGGSAADMTYIAQVLALTHGFPKFEKKVVSFDACEYYAQMQACATFVNTTSALAFNWPNANEANAQKNVPILIPKGYGDTLCTKMLHTLFRPAVYTLDPAAGQADALFSSQVGMMSNQVISTQGSEYSWYNQAGTFAHKTNSAAASSTIGYNNEGTELLFWLSQASGQDTLWSNDRRQFRDLDVEWVPIQFFLEETAWWLEDAFLSF